MIMLGLYNFNLLIAVMQDMHHMLEDYSLSLCTVGMHHTLVDCLHHWYTVEMHHMLVDW